MKYNIIIGSSGLVGTAFYKFFKKKKNFIFFSRSGKNFKKLDLENKILNIPFKEVDKCFFFFKSKNNKKKFYRK